jgi:hypothetical protein
MGLIGGFTYLLLRYLEGRQYSRKQNIEAHDS